MPNIHNIRPEVIEMKGYLILLIILLITIKEYGDNGMNGDRSDIPASKGTIIFNSTYNYIDQNHPNLESFIKRSKQSIGKQKIKLGFKTLQEIRANLVNIQHEWNLWTNGTLNKKV